MSDRVEPQAERADALTEPGLGELGKIALATFARSLAGALVLALVLAGAGFVIARGGLRGALAALLALGLCGALGWALAVKRAIGSALLAGIERLDLARRTVSAVFDHIPQGAQGLAQRVPLAQAEERLRQAVQRRLHAPDSGGGLGGVLRRTAQRRLLLLIEQLCLTRFRRADAEGIDIGQVRDELTSQAQGLLRTRLAATLGSTSLLLLAAGIGGSLLGAWLLRPGP